ncbi:MAG: DUF2807 domain-containing protein [Bacteroidales bacterium]|nr:DUF2807 domain-containing protein [Bacteroidales bacterium]
MKKMILSLMAVLALTSCKFVSVSPGHISADAVVLIGETVVDTLDFKDFHAITIIGQADVDFVQADEYLVVLTATEGVLEYVDDKVEDGTLILSTKKRTHVRSDKYRYTIHAPELTSVTVNGAADLNVSSYLSDKDLKVEVNGAGDIDMTEVNVPNLGIQINGAGDIVCKALEAGSLEVEVNGAGDAKLSGHVGRADFSVNGAGDIDARHLVCENVTKSKHGVGSIKL